MRRGKEGARSPSLGCHTDPNDRSDRPALSRPQRSLPAPWRSGASSPVRACLTSLGREHGGVCAERRATSMNSHRNPLRPSPAMLPFSADQRERFPECQGRPLAGGVSVRSTSNGATMHRTMKRMEARVSFREPGQPCRRSAPVALASTPFVHASPAFNLPPPCLEAAELLFFARRDWHRLHDVGNHVGRLLLASLSLRHRRSSLGVARRFRVCRFLYRYEGRSAAPPHQVLRTA
jgi:hypothetical protein